MPLARGLLNLFLHQEALLARDHERLTKLSDLAKRETGRVAVVGFASASAFASTFASTSASAFTAASALFLGRLLQLHQRLLQERHGHAVDVVDHDGALRGHQAAVLRTEKPQAELGRG